MKKMTEEDKYALKEFLQGAGIVVFVVAVFIGLVLISGGKPINEETFEVVDKYKECDVVRYAPHQVAEYKYFLHCPK
jgi:hypothetical protein